MRSRYRIHDPSLAHFITATIVEWLPVFTTAATCDILVDSLKHCQQHKSLRISAWVILDNHFHAIVSAPDLSAVLSDLKRFTAHNIIEYLEARRCEWLLNQFSYYCKAHKTGSQHQVWQEGSHPQAIRSESTMIQKREYIHLNPVRRGLVTAPEHWRYSSAHEWLQGSAPPLTCDPWR